MRDARLRLIIDIKLIIKGTVVDQENKWCVSVLSVVVSREKKNKLLNQHRRWSGMSLYKVQWFKVQKQLIC